MNRFFSFLFGLWRASYPFNWMALVVGYFTLTYTYVVGWWLWVAWFFNPITLRTFWVLWVKRSELDLLADEAAVIFRAKREEKRERREQDGSE